MANGTWTPPGMNHTNGTMNNGTMNNGTMNHTNATNATYKVDKLPECCMSLEGCNDDYLDNVCSDNQDLLLEEMKPDCCNSTTGCADTFMMEVCALTKLPE
jgi:hypothetical protein